MNLQNIFAERTTKMRRSTFKKRFRLLLDELGYSQKEFSALTGITEAAICHYLNGSRAPSAQSLISIADITTVSPSWLLGYGDDDNIEFM